MAFELVERILRQTRKTLCSDILCLKTTMTHLLRDLDDADRLIGEPCERDLAEPADDPLDLRP